ncbi:MAG: hypothetical protein U0791_25395 [Gemmataceae bacterium]
MSEPTPPTKPGAKLVLVVGLAIALLVIFWRVQHAQQENQLNPPLPGPSAPVVDEMPALVDHFGKMKNAVEGVAIRAKDLKAAQKLTAVQEREGRQHYKTVQDLANSANQFIQDAMERRFRDSDKTAIHKRLAEARVAQDELLDWLARVDRPTVGAGPELDPIKMLDDWLKSIEKENQTRMKYWHERFDSVKIIEWDATR